MRIFSKPAIDVPAQLELLKRRGLSIQNEARAEHFLQAVSFFRLSPYMRPFQRPEELTLGDLSHLYKVLAKDSDKKAIARRLKLPAPLMQSWLHTLTIIRNICAHHSRLWNRELGIRPELPKKANFLWPEHLFQPGPHTRTFAALCILNHLMHQVSPHTRWDRCLYQLIDDFPDVSLKAMGFPQDWYQDPFWYASRD
ncbi:hypothetical protein BFW86_25565 [Pseudomonas fluorescens]|nr:hypothetical protein BFW86_25565 [Pseudomonas fluorescens]